MNLQGERAPQGFGVLDWQSSRGKSKAACQRLSSGVCPEAPLYPGPELPLEHAQIPLKS